MAPTEVGRSLNPSSTARTRLLQGRGHSGSSSAPQPHGTASAQLPRGVFCSCLPCCQEVRRREKEHPDHKDMCQPHGTGLSPSASSKSCAPGQVPSRPSWGSPAFTPMSHRSNRGKLNKETPGQQRTEGGWKQNVPAESCRSHRAGGDEALSGGKSGHCNPPRVAAEQQEQKIQHRSVNQTQLCPI